MEGSIRRGRQKNLVLGKLVVIVAAAAHPGCTVCFRRNGEPGIQVEVGHVEDLDPLATGFGHLGILRLGLGEQPRSIQRASQGLRTELAIQGIANVLPVQTLEISQGQHLSPDGAEGLLIVSALARLIRSKLESLAKIDDSCGDHVGRVQCSRLSSSERALAFCTVGFRAGGLDDPRDIGLDLVDQLMLFME